MAILNDKQARSVIFHWLNLHFTRVASLPTVKAEARDLGICDDESLIAELWLDVCEFKKDSDLD